MRRSADPEKQWERGRQSMLIVLAVLGLMMMGALFVALRLNRYDPVATEFVLKNWRMVLGLPCSSFGAFVVVALFRQGSGPLEFHGLGFSFKGSSGEVVLWAVCFLVLVSAIKLPA